MSVSSRVAAVFLPRASEGYAELTKTHHCVPCSSPAVRLPPGVTLATRHLTGSVLPPRGFYHLVVSNREEPVVLPIGILPQASTPLQSFTQQSSRLATLPLSRGFPPPQRYPSVESHALPGIPPPGSSCVLALTLRLDAFLPRQTPRSVSTGRAHGVRPTELDLTGIAPPLGVASPLAIGGSVCRQEPVRDGFATGVHLLG